MLLKCVNRPFKDLAEGVPRKVGDTWEATPERMAEINRAGYGVMAEPAEPYAEPETEAGPEVEGPRVPTAEELEGMTVKQLVELCVLEKVETPSKPRKDELVDALKAHYGLE